MNENINDKPSGENINGPVASQEIENGKEERDEKKEEHTGENSMTYGEDDSHDVSGESNVPAEENAALEETSETDEDHSPSRFQEYFSEEVINEKPKLTETLLTFIELKKVDEELTEIEEEKGDLPGAIEATGNKISLLDKELDEKRQSLAKLTEEKEKLTTDNSSHEEKINKYDEEKFNVRNNKEYDEIVKAIDALFEEVKKNEGRLKEINEIAGMLETDVTGLEAKTGELKTELTEKQTLLDELDEQYKQDESTLKEKRKELLTKLNPDSVAMYEKINSAYKGEATAIVRKGNCSGCYNSIPPQRVIEIKSAEKIFLCQTCGRILVSEELVNANS